MTIAAPAYGTPLISYASFADPDYELLSLDTSEGDHIVLTQTDEHGRSNTIIISRPMFLAMRPYLNDWMTSLVP